MYETISQERSLFFIDSHYVETFQTLATSLLSEVPEVEANFYNLEHSWTSVFNVWLLLQPDEQLIVESFDKALYYSSNQLLIKALKNDYHFKLLRSNAQSSQPLFFISSIFLANGISRWLQQSLFEHDLQEFAIRFYEMDYYDAHNGSQEDLQQFVLDQARLVKVIVPKLNTNGTFNRMLKQQLDKAYFYYCDHYSLKKA